MRVILVWFVSALVVVGCAAKSDHASRAALDGNAAAPAAPVAAGAAAAKDAPQALVPSRPADNRKVIRTGKVELIVGSYDEARGKLDAMLSAAGGYVDSTQVDRRQNSVSSATLVVRVPADAFTSLLPKLQQLGEVTSETTNAADITDQFVDAEARLASAQQLEKRLLELAAERNGTIDQLLAVERELARVRGEIEGYQGHLKQWSDQVALSTLTIQLYTRATEIAAAPPSLGSQTSGALSESFAALLSVGRGALMLVVALLPWLIVLVPAGLGVRWLVRRSRRKLPVAMVRPMGPSMGPSIGPSMGPPGAPPG